MMSAVAHDVALLLLPGAGGLLEPICCVIEGCKMKNNKKVNGCKIHCATSHKRGPE